VFEEIAVLVGSIIAGAISGAAVVHIVSKVNSSSLKSQRQVVKPFDNAKAELQSLQFEKRLVGEAITRVYEAVQEGKVDSVERDRLLVRYKQQLDSYNEKIGELQSAVDFTDLYEMRNDITGLLERRITAIDQKLGELSKKYGMERREPIKIKQQRFIEKEEENGGGGGGGGVESLAEVEALVEEDKSEGKNIDELQKEIIEALHRLDQVEIGDKEPSKPQTIGTSSTFNDKSCLRQFR
jgi:DNA anti-recombination protein RmuC